MVFSTLGCFEKLAFIYQVVIVSTKVDLVLNERTALALEFPVRAKEKSNYLKHIF